MPDFIPTELVPPGVNDARSRAFVRAFGRLLSNFSTSALLVQDPMRVDARLLPAMTVSLSMTGFVPEGLNETAVRRLLSAAPDIHKFTGTVRGARMALAALGVKVVWKQWYQQQPKGAHDTHVVTAYVNEQMFDDDENLLSARSQAAVLKQLHATQRWSQHIDFQIGVSIAGGLEVAAAGQALQVAIVDASMRTPRRGRTAGGISAASQGVQLGVFDATVATPRRGRGRAHAFAGGQVLQAGIFQATARHRSMR